MGAKRSIRTLRLVDAVTLTAVVLIVVLVSMPRLRNFAQRENEIDALQLVRRLSAALVTSAEGHAPHRVRELIERVPGSRRSLDDARWIDGGRVLVRHGYEFELIDAGGGRVWLLAQPCPEGPRGRVAYRAEDGGAIYVRKLEPGSEPQPLGTVLAAEGAAADGWQPLPSAP